MVSAPSRRCPQPRTNPIVKSGQRVNETGGIHPAGVHTVNVYPVFVNGLGHFPREDGHAPLGTGIGGSPIVRRRFTFQIRHIDHLGVHSPGGHVNDPAGPALAQFRKQQSGKDIGRQKVYRKALFDAFTGFPTRVEKRPRIVDEDMNFGKSVAEFIGQPGEPGRRYPCRRWPFRPYVLPRRP
jgi:hypothetical protein